MNVGILLLTFLTLVGLTACSAPGATLAGAIRPSLILEARAAAQSVHDAYLRVEVEWKTPVLADRQTLELWYVRPDRLRLEIVESGQIGFRDIIFAVRGDQAWMYRHAARQVDVGSADSVRPAIVYDIAQSFTELSFERPLEDIETISKDYIDGKWTFKLTGRSGKTSSDPIQGDLKSNCAVWLDEVTLRPVKVRYQDEAAMEYIATVREAQYNVGLTDDLFGVDFLPTQAYNVNRVD